MWVKCVCGREWQGTGANFSQLGTKPRTGKKTCIVAGGMGTEPSGADFLLIIC